MTLHSFGHLGNVYEGCSVPAQGRDVVLRETGTVPNLTELAGR